MSVTKLHSRSEFQEAINAKGFVVVHLHSSFIPKSELMLKKFAQFARINSKAKFFMVMQFSLFLFIPPYSKHYKLLWSAWPFRALSLTHSFFFRKWNNSYFQAFMILLASEFTLSVSMQKSLHLFFKCTLLIKTYNFNALCCSRPFYEFGH